MHQFVAASEPLLGKRSLALNVDQGGDVELLRALLSYHSTAFLSVLDSWPAYGIIATGLRPGASVHGWG